MISVAVPQAVDCGFTLTRSNNNSKRIRKPYCVTAIGTNASSVASNEAKFRKQQHQRQSTTEKDELMIEIEKLCAMEKRFNSSPLHLYNVKIEIEDKMNGELRDRGISELRYLHNAFFDLSLETFVRAVNIIDRFILRVKVKPKYVGCVAVASYSLAAEYHEDESDVPTPERLVNLSHCGGDANDLKRMKEIILSKLNNDISGTTVYDYLALLVGPVGIQNQEIVSRTQMALTTLKIYAFESSLILAAAIISTSALKVNVSVDTDMQENIKAMAAYVDEIHREYYTCRTPTSRKSLHWTLSRRTLNNSVSALTHGRNSLPSIEEEPPLFDLFGADDFLSMDRDSIEEDAKIANNESLKNDCGNEAPPPAISDDEQKVINTSSSGPSINHAKPFQKSKSMNNILSLLNFVVGGGDTIKNEIGLQSMQSTFSKLHKSSTTTKLPSLLLS